MRKELSSTRESLKDLRQKLEKIRRNPGSLLGNSLYFKIFSTNAGELKKAEGLFLEQLDQLGEVLFRVPEENDAWTMDYFENRETEDQGKVGYKKNDDSNSR